MSTLEWVLSLVLLRVQKYTVPIAVLSFLLLLYVSSLVIGLINFPNAERDVIL